MHEYSRRGKIEGGLGLGLHCKMVVEVQRQGYRAASLEAVKKQKIYTLSTAWGLPPI